MHTIAHALAASLALLATLPAHAAAVMEFTACSGPADTAPCVLEGVAPTEAGFPPAGRRPGSTATGWSSPGLAMPIRSK